MLGLPGMGSPSLWDSDYLEGVCNTMGGFLHMLL